MKKEIYQIILKYWRETQHDFDRTARLAAEEIADAIRYMMDEGTTTLDEIDQMRRDIDEILRDNDKDDYDDNSDDPPKK
jgi:hypothetical protein